MVARARKASEDQKAPIFRSKTILPQKILSHKINSSRMGSTNRKASKVGSNRAFQIYCQVAKLRKRGGLLPELRHAHTENTHINH